jgi:predicted NodU family carbamoyl transferase
LETDLDELSEVKDHVNHVLDTFMDEVRYDRLIIGQVHEVRNMRILASYFTQRHTENMIRGLFELVKPTNLLCVGGVFFNVKINSMLCDMTPGKFCVMPLTGDQGAGLGVYQYHFGDLKWPDHLFWGHRDFIIEDGLEPKRIQSELSSKGIVNLIRRSMEFGPRSLCNTSTLALPSLDNVELINQMNDRTTEMPMALVVTENQAQCLFEDLDKVHKSLEYMIITRRFKKGRQTGLEGGAHYYPLTDEWTCRPQITKDPDMVKILEEFGPLINTSANVHGQPIVFDLDQITYMHQIQSKTFPITTVIMNGGQK